MSETRTSRPRAISGASRAAMATAVSVTTMATPSCAGLPLGASMVIASAKAAAAEIGAVSRLPGISTRRYSPPAMARRKATRSRPGRVRGAVRDADGPRTTRLDRVSTRPRMPSRRSTPTRAGHLTCGSRRRRAAPRAGRPSHRTGRDRRGRSPGPPPGSWPGSRVRSCHGSRTRPRRRAATTTGSNWVPARRSTSSRASSTGRAARSAFAVVSDSKASATATIRANSGICSPDSPEGYPRPSKRSWWMLDAVECRREELDVPHDLRATSRMLPDAGRARRR